MFLRPISKCVTVNIALCEHNREWLMFCVGCKELSTTDFYIVKHMLTDALQKKILVNSETSQEREERWEDPWLSIQIFATFSKVHLLFVLWGQDALFNIQIQYQIESGRNKGGGVRQRRVKKLIGRWGWWSIKNYFVFWKGGRCDYIISEQPHSGSRGFVDKSDARLAPCSVQ